MRLVRVRPTGTDAQAPLPGALREHRERFSRRPTLRVVDKPERAAPL
jgi:hypothetical protein